MTPVLQILIGVAVALAVVVLLVVGAVVLVFIDLWPQVKAAGVPVGLLDMVVMRLRQIDPARVVRAMITLYKAGLEVRLDDLQVHVMSGGDLDGVADALVSASKAGLDVDFAMLAAIDLAGRDVVDAVNTRVQPKVLVCPPATAQKDALSGVSRDGIRLAARARITVRTQLDRLVGGAGADTIVARVGEGIVSAIGRAPSHREILEKPELISEHILARGLDSGTCFEIVSVDISDIDVLDNISARLKSAQAGADKRIAQAQAEVRRAAAIAAQQEMVARTKEMEGRVTSAKSRVPLALSAAVAEANFGNSARLQPTMQSRLRWSSRRD
ncbi:MAG: UPF0365 family protein [Lentisphaerae bacterium]|jgi:uncharacterized protein YqfA (UPF0365 family)|nr:UPF0365 family protein [Lentisphaerota bacterium]MBT4818388.1 UPF0365 family protein [Lentisphaerota bacterium]MBT5611589.1 UPF0365 family protein [Lentisphaerota bacterium]MBT7061688.1 UPF0365 family protein [Lentisphaerota bacterium]MBT7846534.1 UPF0365 family protein [Lentisphaerota bacterium]